MERKRVLTIKQNSSVLQICKNLELKICEIVFLPLELKHAALLNHADFMLNSTELEISTAHYLAKVKY